VRLQKRFKDSGVEVMMVTRTLGSWGLEPVVPGPEEVKGLTDYYLNKHKITFPIAIWEGEKIPQEDGGILPAPSPTWAAYHVYLTPQITVVDTEGKIREVLASFDRDDEERVYQTVMKILREKKQ
jgi:hypothetical protein